LSQLDAVELLEFDVSIWDLILSFCQCQWLPSMAILTFNIFHTGFTLPGISDVGVGDTGASELRLQNWTEIKCRDE
jgi:hypothetical protein